MATIFTASLVLTAMTSAAFFCSFIRMASSRAISSNGLICFLRPGVAKVVDIDPLGSMGLSKGSIKA
ncbi:hypothetical protein T12_4141 [Trichinella patagoniensis]|uniref:Uncharacterized protein n=1 Tax=Trichinella patagoniensis TaxID=990121 RepID=A0A0V1A5D3_9BILA|nr:hypothetical protein T12_4141 [Trichinella patagoniensis]